MDKETSKSSLSRPEQAALLLMTLGENQAAEILKHMGPKEVQVLGTNMQSISNVTQSQIAEVLDEFTRSVGNQTSLSIGSEDYLKSILQKALGKEKAQSIMSRISMSSGSKGLDMLKWMDSQTINDLIRDEHPQIIAIVLIYLEQDQASEVIALLPEETRTEVIMRIAKMDGINPSALSELDAIMENRFSSNLNMKIANVGGHKAAANLLNGLSGDLGTQVLEKMRELDSDLSNTIQDQMFVFENLLELDDRGFQTLLREISTDDLMRALKGCGHEIQEKIFKNMSKRAAEMLRDDLETSGPVRLKEVEDAQRSILTVARSLADEGKIMLGSGGDDFV